MGDLIFELALTIGIAALLALIVRAIKQPPIISYLLTGIIVGPLVLNILKGNEIIETFAHIGVALLLFIVGLNLDFRVLREIGGIAVLAGVGEIVAVSAIGFAVALILGISYVPALYVAAALAFSSTVVVVKLLSDKKEIDTLHGRIALGILIVEDFVAALVLMIIPVIKQKDLSLIFAQLGKGALLIIAVLFVGYVILPRLLKIIARNQEILFLFSVAWALVVAVTFSSFGFSLEIGALLAGIALAHSKFALEIGSKIKGTRDFFVVLFFVYFGAQLAGAITPELVFRALIFSALILVGKPIIVMSFMRFVGYKKRTNFFTGISLAQISEFSLILVLLGFTLGHIDQSIMSLVLLIAIITITLSSYSTYYSHKIFERISRFMGFFDGKKNGLDTRKKDELYDIVLFGCNRIGYNIAKMLETNKKKYIIVDYNPKTIIDLIDQGINCIYGDANDIELLDDLSLNKAKMVISTIPDVGTNLSIKSRMNKDGVFIPTSHFISDTEILYSSGADYVIMPHFLGGEHTADLIVKSKFNKRMIKSQGINQRKDLKERKKLGHRHPGNETNH